MRLRDKRGFEAGAGPRPRRMDALHRLGSALAAIQLAALPGYAFDRTALAGESRAEPAAAFSSKTFSRLGPFLYEGAPPLVAAGIPAHAEQDGQPRFSGPGQALGNPLSRQQDRAVGDWQQGNRSRVSAQAPLASLFIADAERDGHRQLPFPGPGQALRSPLSRHQGRSGGDREPGDRSRFSAPLYLSAAVTVSAAAVARFSKDRADDAYETYLKSAGRQRQQNHFEEAERYDRIAGAAFAVMEAGLVWSVYLLFF